MADQKVTELDAVSSASGTDLVYLVVDPAGTPLDKNITVANLFKSETDRVVGAVSGIVKGNGSGTISAATADTDYLVPTTAASTYEPKKGTDDNYVTDAKLIVIGNTSGTNTGDQTLPVKAIGSEVDTGTDDAKFVTAKAINDSHNVPSVAPSTNGNVMTSNGTDWVSSTPASGGTVTSVSVTTANGVSGTVATATTTPAISLTLGAITPSTVNGLTLASQTVGFTVAGGTISKTLTVDLDATVRGTNTGDQDLSGLVTKATYDAQTILHATTDNTPVALTVGEQTVVGRVTGGNIAALAIDSDLTTVSAAHDTLPSALAVKTVTDGKKNYHGIQTIGALSFDNTGHILTIASGTNTYWYQGVKFTTASAITCDIDTADPSLTTNRLYFFYFDDASGTLKCNHAFWDLRTKVPVATVLWNGSAGAVIYEAHGYDRSIDWHINAHLTIGTRYYTGLVQTAPTTAADATLTIGSGTIYDEDLALTSAEQSVMRGLYMASAGVYTWADYSTPYLGGATQPQYLDTDTYALTNVGESDYVCMWVYACGDTSRPIYIIPTHAATAYNTIAAARIEAVPSLSGLNINSEMKLLYRWIYRGDGQYQERVDYRNSSSLPAGGTSAVNATSVSFAPSGNIAATNVQAALEELDTEKSAIDQTMYIGTTATAINRASAALTLAGLTLTTPDIGTPSAGTLTNCTGLPLAGVLDSTTEALGVGSLEVGHATDTTIARVSAGVISVEGVTVDTISAANTLTNKTLTSPKIGTNILDTNGNELLILTAVSSAVNEITLANGSTGNSATITASGETNTGITITGKGTKGVNIGNALTEKEITVSDGAGAVLDMSTGNSFYWSAAVNRTAGTPTNPPPAGTKQTAIIAFYNSSGGSITVTLPTATTNDFRFGTSITTIPATPTLKTTYIGVKYNHAASRWDVIALSEGH